MRYLSETLLQLEHEADLPAGFQRLTELPLVIFVGLTGVGKSTTIDQLRTSQDSILLPNRRQVTDEVIIGYLQALDGQPQQPVTDRLQRFNYTARYRGQFPGGMAHALTQLAARVPAAGPRLLFDGLRGLDEARHAVAYFPAARFVVLDAPDTVRLSRLLVRADAFDSVAGPGVGEGPDLLAGVPDIERVFSPAEQRHLSQAAMAAGVAPAELVKKASIIVEERRHYDSQAARVYLTQTLPPAQILEVDTAQHPPAAVADQLRRWLREGG